MAISNLPKLHTLSLNMFGEWELNGVSYFAKKDAEKAAFQANKKLLVDTLTTWGNGYRHYLFNYAYPLGEAKESLKIAYELEALLPRWLATKNEDFETEQGGHILFLVNRLQPYKTQTQQTVNWLRAQHLTKLFFDKYLAYRTFTPPISIF